MEVMNELLNFTDNNTVRAILVLAVVILLIIVLGYFMRGISRRGAGHKRGRVARLSIIEAIAVDQRRRLVLVRRDNTEHLLMIGGSSDVLIEEKIQRVARPASAQRHPAERVDPRTAIQQQRPALGAVSGDVAAQQSTPAAGPSPVAPKPTPIPAPRPGPANQQIPTAPAVASAPVRTTAAAVAPAAIPMAPTVSRPTGVPSGITSPAETTPVNPPASSAPIEPPKMAPTPSTERAPAPINSEPAPSTISSVEKVETVVAVNDATTETTIDEASAPPISAKARQLAEMERQLESALRGSVAGEADGDKIENSDKTGEEVDSSSDIPSSNSPEAAASDDLVALTPEDRTDTQHESTTEKTGS